MKDSSSILQGAPMSILLIGPPGVGKSFLASFFSRPYFLNADNNLRGVVKKRQQLGFNSPIYFDEILYASAREELEMMGMSAKEAGSITVTKIGGVEAFPIPREWRGRRLWSVLKVAIESENIDTIVLDSLTTITDVVMDEVLRQQAVILPKKGAANLPALLGTNTFRTVDDPLEHAHWQAFGKLMRNLFTTCFSSGKRVIAIGHINVIPDALDVPMEYVAIPGKFRDQISGLFEESWLLSVEMKGTEPIRRITTTTSKPTMKHLGLKTAAGLDTSFVLDIKELMKTLEG